MLKGHQGDQQEVNNIGKTSLWGFAGFCCLWSILLGGKGSPRVSLGSEAVCPLPIDLA